MNTQILELNDQQLLNIQGGAVGITNLPVCPGPFGPILDSDVLGVTPSAMFPEAVMKG